MKRFLSILLLLLVLLAVLVVVRATTLRSTQIAASPAPALDFDRDAAVERLAGALRFRTVSNLDPSLVDGEQFRGLHRYFEAQFPLVHQRLEKELVSEFSLLFTWRGSDPSLAPALFLSHQDVVPIEPGTEARWTQPPFEGRIADGFLWGRGTLDDKFGVVGLLQAAEILLAQGYAPKRTILFAFGHDEEVGGGEGAAKIAALLAERGVRAEIVLDEGGSVVSGAIPGLAQRVALVGTAEKGFLTLELTAKADGGHSSAPPDHTAIGMVSAAVAKIEADQMPMRITAPVRGMAEALAPEMPFLPRLVLANLWLTRPLIELGAARMPPIAASLRTTTAATMIDGGVKDNVLPSSASAVFNFRILSGDTVASVTEHVRTIAGERIELSARGKPREPSPESPTDGAAFATLNRTIREIFPDAIVSPFLVIGGTDARNYTAISKNVYRFTPIVGVESDLKRIHGTDERMSIENYGQVVSFFAQLLRNFGG